MLRARLTRMRTELAQARVRLEELEDQHRFDEQRFRVFEAERTGLRDALSADQRQAEQRARDTARAHARELEEQLEPLRARVEALTEQRDELAAKVDQLVADNAEHERSERSCASQTASARPSRSRARSGSRRSRQT